MMNKAVDPELEVLQQRLLALEPAQKDDLLVMLMEFKRARTIAENYLRFRAPSDEFPIAVEKGHVHRSLSQTLPSASELNARMVASPQKKVVKKTPQTKSRWSRRRSSLPELAVIQSAAFTSSKDKDAKQPTSQDDTLGELRSPSMSFSERLMKKELNHSSARRDSRLAKGMKSILSGFQPQGPGMKLIFLDIDGVLHSMAGYKTFHPDCMKRLVHIVENSGARIVLSSTWRNSEKTLNIVNQKLEEAGLEVLYDITPLEGHTFRRRSEEIIEWLDAHADSNKPHVTHWVAIDDMDLGVDPRMKDHFVLTNGETGIEEKDVPLALKLLDAA